MVSTLREMFGFDGWLEITQGPIIPGKKFDININ